MINISITEQVSVVTFGNIPYESESDFIYRLFSLSADENINIDMISKASVSTDRTSVGFTFSDNDMPLMLKVLGNLSFYRPPLVSCGNVKISVKTSDMINGKGFAMKVFGVLSELNITPILVTTAEDEISVVVRESDSSDFERRLKTVFLC
ncbi:MAG: hypothetical protein IJX15_02555 [Ruminiclostridium sp.]|nr:hypothetical protein [Ruminiclostridium sp.]MBQ8841393.1 hypothetical protein [Ruminiclostridium sp.]